MTAARRSLLSRWLASPPPAAGVEIAPERVTAVAVSRGSGLRTVSAHASEPLPAGAVVPALNAPNVIDRDALVAALRRALDRIGRPRRVGLVLPDIVAKVSLVRLETVPPRAADLQEILRWQVRKAAPFPPDRAQVTWTTGVDLPEGGREFVVVLMRRDIVEEYETACAACGVHAGVVDLATFNLVNVVLLGDRQQNREAAGDWLLVHLATEYSTLAIVRGDRLVFYRNRMAEADGHLADLVHQTAMYYEDRLGGGGFARVIVSGSQASLEADGGELRRALTGRLRSPVDVLDPRSAASLADRIDAAPDLLSAVAAPIGLVLRDA